jgi:predicted membrane-bound mannosyltransferase
MTSPRTSRHHGSTLIIVVILLAVLAAIGAAAVSLSARERINASAKGSRDRMVACAHAARLAIWAEIAKAGSGYYQSTGAPTSINLPDGSTITAPAHYAVDMTGSMTVKDVVLKNSIGSSAGATYQDHTNAFKGVKDIQGSAAYTAVARCTDASGNELEVEFITGLTF